MPTTTAKRPSAPRELDWVNIAFLGVTPVVAVLGTAWYIWQFGVTWLELANFLVMFALTGMAVTGGYHRYYAHRTYEARKPLQLFYLIFGAAAVENSTLNWASDHRYHHRFVDQEEDPYNILRGGLYAHMGWIFYKNTRDVHLRYNNVPDLLKDPLVIWQNRWYLPIVILTTFALPTYVGLIQGRPVGGLLWGGFLRVIVVHHMTFLINSVAHLYGSRPYTLGNTARDNWWLGPLTFGEGYHNFHHAFQADYRNGIRWWQFDVTKWWILAMRGFGLAHRLRRAPEPLILAARLRVEAQRVEARLAAAGASERMWQKVGSRLDAGQRRLSEAMARYHAARIEYIRRKDEWTAEMRRSWRERLEVYKDEFGQARERWREQIRAFNRIPHPSAQGLLTFTAVLDVLKYRLF